MRILVTGTAGFIGFHLAKRLLDRGDEVYGADNLNNYYDVRLKHARLAQLEGRPGFTFQRLDLADRNAVPELFQRVRPQRVIHLAAQAGVRYSLTNPHAYVDAKSTTSSKVWCVCPTGWRPRIRRGAANSPTLAQARRPTSSTTSATTTRWN